MSPFEPVDPRAEVHDDREQITKAARERALALAEAGFPLSAAEMALIFREGISQFHKKVKLGAYDDFLLRPSLGPKHFSGAKVMRYLRGEILEPARVFGRKRRVS